MEEDYKTYSNWMLMHDLIHFTDIYRKQKSTLHSRADETLFREKALADLLARLDKICDEMNIRGI